MATPKLTTLGPELLRDIRWTIDRVKRMVGGDLRDDERKVPLAPDDVIIATPAEGLPARDGSTIYGESSQVYGQGNPSGGARTVSAITDHTLASHCTEEVPMGGAVLWPAGLLKSGARHLMPGPDHVVGKPNGTGITAAEEDYYGVLTPGKGSLDLYYWDSQYETLLPWEIDSVQQTLDVLTWSTSAITDTDSFVSAHRDRWLNWWVEQASSPVGFYVTNDAGNVEIPTAGIRYPVGLDYATIFGSAGWTADEVSDEWTCVIPGKYTVHLDYRIRIWNAKTVQALLKFKRGAVTTTIDIVNMVFPEVLSSVVDQRSGTVAQEFEADDILWCEVYRQALWSGSDEPRLIESNWVIHKKA